MFNVGDEVVIKDPHWHEGANVGGRLGYIISLSGYVLVQVYDYESNPVKCFRSEVQKISYGDPDDYEMDYTNEEFLDNILGDWFK